MLHLIQKNRRVGDTVDPHGSEAMHGPRQGGGGGDRGVVLEGERIFSPFKIGREQGKWLPGDLLESPASSRNDPVIGND